MDRLIKGLAFDGQVRLVGISSTCIVQNALDIHGLSPVATLALGRLLTAGAMMGYMMKSNEDRLTLMLKGDGPLGNLIVCGNSKGIVKGYVRNPVVDLPLKGNGSLDVGAAVGKNGTLTVVRDIGLKVPQSGSVKIVDGEIGTELATYFLESEQIASAVNVGVSVKKDATVSFAGGYIIQLMPGTDSAIIDMIEGRINNMKPICELFNEGFSIEDILKAVSGDDNAIILDETEPKFMCDCSRERMEQALNTVSIEEKEDMLEKDGFIELKCSFCQRVERWNKV